MPHEYRSFDVLVRLLPFPSLVVADLGFPSSLVLDVSFRFLLASSTPATRKQEFFVYCECELQYCKELDVVGILLRMEQQRHRRRGGRMAALSEKNLRTLLGFFLGCFVTMNLNLHSLVDLELSSTSSDALGPIGEAEKERTRRLRRPYSASLQQQQPQPQQHTSSNTSPLAGIRILVAITSFCV